MSLGIVIATPGRRSLARTLQSIYYQREPVADVLVVGDGYDAPTEELVAFFAEVGLPARYIATQRTRDWGHSQINYGLKHVRGDYVTYQDDDDIYMPRALEEMDRLSREVETPRPILGRVKTPRFGLLWQRPDDSTVLDGHCLVAPNDKRRLGWMASDYNGDQGLIHTTVRNYNAVAWCDRVWTLTRPSWKLMPWEMKHGDDWWEWTLCDETTPRVVLHMAKHEEHDFMTVDILWLADGITQEELGEVAQFAVFAAQGNDVRFKINIAWPDSLRDALTDWNYKEHYTDEYSHDWPPDFWAYVAPFDHTVGADGQPLKDWRDDIWGGRSVS